MKKKKSSKVAYQERYQKEKCKCITLKLNKETDADVIEILESVGNKQGYIKELIRKDNERKKDKALADHLRERGY